MTDYKCQVQGSYAGQHPWSFGMHITSAQNESTLAATWANMWNNVWTNGTYGLEVLYPTTTSITGFSVATLNATMKEITKTTTSAALPGTATGDTLPYLNSILISMRSNGIQKHQRGRIYLPAPEETFVNVDVVIPTAVTRLVSAMSNVLLTIGADGSNIFVTNRLALKDLTPPFQKTPITRLLVSNKPARQSRRANKIPAVYS